MKNKNKTKVLKESDMNNFWIKLWNLLAPSQKKIIAFLSIVFLVELVSLVPPFLLKKIIDNLSDLSSGEYKEIAFFIFLMFLTDLSNSLFYHFRDKLGVSIIAEVRHYMSVSAQRALMMLSLSYHEKESTGGKISKVERGVDKINSMLNNMMWSVIPTLVQLAMTSVALLITDYRIGISFLFFAPLFLLITFKASVNLRPFRRERFKKYEKASGMIGQSIININTVKSFVQERREIKKYQRLRGLIKEGEIKEWYKTLNFELARLIVMDLGRISVIVLGSWFVYTGQLSIGTIVFVLTLSEKAYSSMYRLSTIYDQVEEAREGVNRLVELIEEESEIISPKNGLKPKDLVSDIHFNNVSFSYDGNGSKALREVNLDIPGGRMTALVGPSGGGKTTIARMIFRHYDPQAGEVSINEHDLKNYDLDAFRSCIAIVPQEVEIFNCSIRENISYAKPKASEEEILEVARISNSLEFIEKLEKGLETEVGERGMKLSGGQRQRIGIARALLADPSILIFDEATSNLDSQSERLIQEAMDKVIKGRTVIVIAHRLSTIQKADKIVVFEEGRIVEEGNHSELVNRSGGLYARLSELQNIGEVT